ncbi:MAG: putative amino-acid racemase [Candidatus Anoxychlamydiales bacterium]|nr:putative amino-acid racemase [Candidatus Anoxychlamydiales bacterium]
MQNRRKKTIGIIGGAGPMAGVLLMQKIITICQKKYKCINDFDFPKIILLSYPFAEMLKPLSFQQDEKKVTKQLKEALKFLKNSGMDYITIACNTLHGFINDTYRNKLIGLIAETKSFLLEQNLSKVLVLCTKTSGLKGLFYNFANTKLLSPKELQWIEELIKKVLSGTFSLQDRKSLENFILSSIKKDPSINGILLGCTELSVLMDNFSRNNPKIKIIDPLEIVSNKLCKLVFNKQRGE